MIYSGIYCSQSKNNRQTKGHWRQVEYNNFTRDRSHTNTETPLCPAHRCKPRTTAVEKLKRGSPKLLNLVKWLRNAFAPLEVDDRCARMKSLAESSAVFLKVCVVFHSNDCSNKALDPTDLPILVGGAGITHDAYGVRCEVCEFHNGLVPPIAVVHFQGSYGIGVDYGGTRVGPDITEIRGGLEILVRYVVVSRVEALVVGTVHVYSRTQFRLRLRLNNAYVLRPVAEVGWTGSGVREILPDQDLNLIGSE
jgi:hypothetical protein